MDSQSLFNQLQDYDKNRKSSVDVLNDAMGKYGVPEIRSRVSGLRTTLSNTENALNAVDPSVTGRTQGSLVSEAQRQKQVANERAPIAQQYGEQTKALGNESANLSDQLQAAQLLAQNQVSDYDRGRQALSSQYDAVLGREAEKRRREEADRAYQFQVQAANDARRAASGSGASPSIGGDGGTAPKALSQQRSGGGFNFQDSNNKSISAGQYAKATGKNIGDLLYEMGKNGDKYAQQAYNQIKANQDYYNKNPNVLKSEFAPLFWGT